MVPGSIANSTLAGHVGSHEAAQYVVATRLGSGSDPETGLAVLPAHIDSLDSVLNRPRIPATMALHRLLPESERLACPYCLRAVLLAWIESHGKKYVSRGQGRKKHEFTRRVNIALF